MAKLSNWRMLERELVDIARIEGFKVREDRFSNKVISMGEYNFNITNLAQKLTERGVTISRTVIGARE